MYYNFTISDEEIAAIKEMANIIEHEAELICPIEIPDGFISRYQYILPNMMRVLEYKQRGGI